MNTFSNKRKFDFSIEAILHMTCEKKLKTDTNTVNDILKVERPESPSSTTCNDLSLLSTSSSSPSSSLSPSSFPQWTQCQRENLQLQKIHTALSQDV